MVVTEISMIHHVSMVLLLIWLLDSYAYSHPIIYFLSIVYLHQVNERCNRRLRRKFHFEEKKAANQRRILTDSETVRWLNHAVEKMWPVCMEKIISQKIFLSIIPWFLAKYKPWTVKQVDVQNLYLGRTPPLFTDLRVLHESSDDDHLVLELGLKFLTADDMNATLTAKLRKSLGFGIVTKMHLTGMHVEGKVLIGVKFLRSWPYIGRLRVCFVEPPYFQMNVKPVSHHGIDVTELPGIAGWLDNLLAVAFEETLVEPNMLVVDLTKFVSPHPENWFSMDVKETAAYVNVEVIEAAELKPSDLNGLADPYIRGHLGSYRFKTQIQRKTLFPKWLEEFKVPVCSWESQNMLEIEVLDKDRFLDDVLGNCSVNVSELRDGLRHDMWLPLENVKLGRLHLAITIVANGKEIEPTSQEKSDYEKPDLQSDLSGPTPVSTKSSNNSQKVSDTFEAIDVKGQKETGIWVHHPGSETSQAWETRKGKTRHVDSEIPSVDTPKSSRQSPDQGNSSNDDEGKESRRRRIRALFHKGVEKIRIKHPKAEDYLNIVGDNPPSPHANVKSVHVKKVGVNVEMSDVISEPTGATTEGSGAESSSRYDDIKGRAKDMLKNVGKTTRQLKHKLSRKGSSKFLQKADERVPVDSSPSDDEDSRSSSLCDDSVGVPNTSSLISRGDIDGLGPDGNVYGIPTNTPTKMPKVA